MASQVGESSPSIPLKDEVLVFGIIETPETEKFCKPSQEKHAFSILYCLKDLEELEDSFGKWMVFKHYDEVDETWEAIREAMNRDELQGCQSSACSTLKYHPTIQGPGPSTTAVICVYTEEHNMDAIGFKLIEIAKQDIKYKTEEASESLRYTHAGHGRVSIKTIFWNDGKPSFECEDRRCFGTSLRKEDIWHLNVVTAPEPMDTEEAHGRWILYLEYEELTELWYLLKEVIEDKEKNYGIIRMVCPPKRVRNSDESPVFHIYTSRKSRKDVGKRLIQLTKSDIKYEHKPPRRDMAGFVETLYWNDGEPDYETIRRKGITKNWRTGEDVQPSSASTTS